VWGVRQVKQRRGKTRGNKKKNTTNLHKGSKKEKWEVKHANWFALKVGKKGIYHNLVWGKEPGPGGPKNQKVNSSPCLKRTVQVYSVERKANIQEGGRGRRQEGGARKKANDGNHQWKRLDNLILLKEKSRGKLPTREK